MLFNFGPVYVAKRREDPKGDRMLVPDPSWGETHGLLHGDPLWEESTCIQVMVFVSNRQ